MKNNYKVDGEKTIIFLRRKTGETLETIVDTNDLSKLKNFDVNWYAAYDPKGDCFYVQAWKNEKTFILHRFLLDYPKGKVVDHKNHNTLDNRMHNLRALNYSGNGQNRAGAQKDSKSGVRGIHWVVKHKRWRVQATINGKKLYFGMYRDLEKAKQVITEFRKEFMPYSIESDGTERKIDIKAAESYARSVRESYRLSDSGVRYVYWHKATKKWTATPMMNGEKIYLGVFGTIKEAEKAIEKYYRSTKAV
jgi:hypothetical protein